MEQLQASKIIAAFFLGLIIIYTTARVIGPENKYKWFKKRQKLSFFNMRGLLGDTLHFGYPCTWQGLVVTLIMYGAIFSAGYFLVFHL